ncbi:MAG: hypothetical protein ACYTXI_11170 [Nostoc sp.]
MDRLLRLETPLVTTFVLLEVADALCTPVSRIQTVAFINSLRVLKSVQIIPFDQKLLGWMKVGCYTASVLIKIGD